MKIQPLKLKQVRIVKRFFWCFENPSGFKVAVGGLFFYNSKFLAIKAARRQGIEMRRGD